MSLRLVPVSFSPHLSVAQEVLDGKSVTWALCRDSFFPASTNELQWFISPMLFLLDLYTTVIQWHVSLAGARALQESWPCRLHWKYTTDYSRTAALEGSSCKILPKGLKMEQRWWTCNCRIAILSSPKVAFQSYYCKWERAFTLLFMVLSLRVIFIYFYFEMGLCS